MGNDDDDDHRLAGGIEIVACIMPCHLAGGTLMVVSFVLLGEDASLLDLICLVVGCAWLLGCMVPCLMFAGVDCENVCGMFFCEPCESWADTRRQRQQHKLELEQKQVQVEQSA